jgi:hypothetical protein
VQGKTRRSIKERLRPTCFASPDVSSALRSQHNTRLPQSCQNTLRLGFDKPARRALDPHIRRTENAEQMSLLCRAKSDLAERR